MFAGLDIGTTAVKFSVYSENFDVLEEKTITHGALHGGRFDFDVALQAARQAICACAKYKREVQALAVSTLGEVMQPLDAAGRPLQDVQPLCGPYVHEFQELCSSISPQELFERTGILPQPKFACVGFLHRSKAGKDDQASRFVLMEDYIVHALTGEYAASVSSASRTMMVNRYTGDWDEKLLKLARVPEGTLSRLEPSGALLGTVCTKAAEELGLPPGAKVVAGGHDQMCNALGTSLYGTDHYVNCSGTVESIGLFCTDIGKKQAYQNQMQLCPAPKHRGCFTFYAPVKGCGTLDQFMSRFGEREMRQAALAGIHPHDFIEKQCTQEPSPILTLPFWGERGYPDPNQEKQAFIYGVNEKTTKAQLWQSLLEGITFEDKRCLEIYLENGLERSAVCAVGGGAKSRYWLQLKADILGCPVKAIPQKQAGTLGAALLASGREGMWRAEMWQLSGQTLFFPDSVRTQMYAEKYERYKKMSNSRGLDG